MFSVNWHLLGKAAMDRHRGIASLNPLVIVVDDDAAVRNSLKFLLEIDGFAVRTYESAQELVREGDSSDCRCLIVDQDMPHMTGFELVAALRKEGFDVPAILISGNVTPALTTRASNAGIPVIEKPIVGNGLTELIRTAIGTKPH
jgi:FixJ family two-component response regulator